MNYKLKRNMSITPCSYGMIDYDGNIVMVGSRTCQNCYCFWGIDRKNHSVECATETTTTFKRR